MSALAADASAIAAPAITVMAPAKINLSLHVCGRRADGYHLLESLVVFAGVGDRITVSPADELRLTVEGPFAGALSQEPDNLVLRAARLLAGTLSPAPGAAIILEKNLPVASGIGGGSADAAATLVACARLWRTDARAFSDQEIAAKLGADVPVCLAGVPAFMSGVGEIVAPAPALPEAALLLVNPGQPLATKAVFAALNGRLSTAPSRALFTGLADPVALAKALARADNDLAEPACDLMPEIIGVLAALAEIRGCLLARLSGSGPTCFGLFADLDQARRAGAILTAREPTWWVAAAPVLRAPDSSL